MNIFIVFFCVFIANSSISAASINTTNRITISGNYSKPLNLNIDSNTEYIIEYSGNNDINPVKLTVFSLSATNENPLLIVAQQQTRVTSWQIPFIANPLKNPQSYNNLAHILCPSTSIAYAKKMPTQMITKTLYKDPMFSNPVVTIKAPAKGSRYSFTLNAEIQKNFFIKSGVKYEAQVTVSQPVYFYYSFLDPNNSADKSGSVLIQATSKSFTCMIISIQNSTCPVFDLEYNVKFDSYWQTMTNQAGIVVKKSVYPKGFYIVMVVKQEDSECGKNLPDMFTLERQKPVTLKVTDTITKQEHLTIAMSTIGIFGGIFVICIIVGIIFLVRVFHREQHEVNVDGTDAIALADLQENPRWRTLLRASSRSKKSTNYVWHVGIVALFYTFPVLQLVFTYQGIVHDTGNEDLCYYNFLCAHPLGIIYDFNHVFSNIGYVILGLLFLIITYLKELMERGTRSDIYGLPKPFGMFYALGFALIMEGVMSACYHICPKSSNFQFDTSFMYIMTILMIVNIYENRHNTGDTRGYTVFGILAGATTLSVISLVIGEELYFWVLFGILQISFCCFLTWSLEKLLIKHLFNAEERKTITWVHICRIILWIIGNVLNWLLVAYGIFTRSGFGTYLLMVLIVNGLYYTIYYISMKICHKERILIITWIFIVLSTVVWGFALYFFVYNVTAWEKTAAESRNLNEKCLLVNYFDSHDVWHFLSSVALFLTFIVLLTLDEGLATVQRTDIVDFHGY